MHFAHAENCVTDDAIIVHAADLEQLKNHPDLKKVVILSEEECLPLIVSQYRAEDQEYFRENLRTETDDWYNIESEALDYFYDQELDSIVSEAASILGVTDPTPISYEDFSEACSSMSVAWLDFGTGRVALQLDGILG